MTENQTQQAHSQRYIDALGRAAELHSFQTRKGKPVPYIAHLIADIVLACTDTDGPTAAGATKPPWIERKTAYIENLAAKPQEAWLVTAADKAHNARDMVLDANVDPSSWDRFRAGLDGSAWYLWSLHSKLKELLPDSRSVALLGQSVQTILESPALQAKAVPVGQSVEEWVAKYLERPETHPKD